MTIGKKIEICRKKEEMSIKDLSNLLNKSEDEIKQIEANKKKLTKEELVILSRVFNVSLEWLSKENNQKAKENSQEAEEVAKKIINREDKSNNQKKKKKKIIWTVSSIVLLISIVISIVIPVSFCSNNKSNTSYNNKQSEREIAWKALYDKVKSGNKDRIIIRTETNKYFNKDLYYEFIVYYEDRITLRSDGEWYTGDEKSSYCTISAWIDINNEKEQNFFTGSATFGIHDNDTSDISDSLLSLVLAKSEYQSTYTDNKYISLNTIQILENQLTNFTMVDFYNIMSEAANEAMKTCYSYIHNYLKTELNIEKGLNLFGITCV